MYTPCAPTARRRHSSQVRPPHRAYLRIVAAAYYEQEVQGCILGLLRCGTFPPQCPGTPRKACLHGPSYSHGAHRYGASPGLRASRRAQALRPPSCARRTLVSPLPREGRRCSPVRRNACPGAGPHLHAANRAWAYLELMAAVCCPGCSLGGPPRAGPVTAARRGERGHLPARRVPRARSMPGAPMAGRRAIAGPGVLSTGKRDASRAGRAVTGPARGYPRLESGASPWRYPLATCSRYAHRALWTAQRGEGASPAPVRRVTAGGGAVHGRGVTSVVPGGASPAL